MTQAARPRPSTLVPALALLLLLSAGSHAIAQGPPAAGDPVELRERLDRARGGAEAPAALAGPVDPDHYRLGPGDVLQLEYGGRTGVSRRLEVDSEGKLLVPNLGPVDVSRYTLAEARRRILSDLRPFLPRADLDLRLLEPRFFKVFVLGSVTSPGAVTVRGSARVLEALEEVDGLADDASSRNIQVLRRDGREEIADLFRFRWTGDWSANPYLEDGDRIVVPTLTRRISVRGAVARPSVFEFNPTDSLAGVIEVAGGPLPEAILDSVLVLRYRGADLRDTLIVDLAAVLAGEAPDRAVQEDDRVFLRPRSQWRPKHEVRVLGEVNHPGVYAIEESEDRISDAVEWAGGFTPSSAIKSVRLIRRPERNGEDVEFERLSRLSRAEMTDSEYQIFRSKLAIRQSAYLVDFSQQAPLPDAVDILLRDGDLIHVGRLELAVRVDGSVRRPGFVAYQPGRNVRAYVEQAGGTSGRADFGNTRITRAGSSDTKRAKDVRVVEPGDFIWVPEKKETSFWNTFKDVISVAGQVATIVILVDTLGNP